MILAPKSTIASDVLSKDFITVSGECTLDQAIEKMIETYLSEVFVVSQDNHLMGILTLKDIADIKKKKLKRVNQFFPI